VIALVRFLYLLALGLWIGEIAVFSFLVAPAVFRTLGPAVAGDAIAAIFPGYYALGTAAAAAAVGLGLVLRSTSNRTGWWTAAVVVVALGLAAILWAGTVVQPRARQLRVAMHAAGEDSPAAAEFRRLHGRAVALNGAALVAGLVGLGLSAAGLRH